MVSLSTNKAEIIFSLLTILLDLKGEVKPTKTDNKKRI